MAESQISAYQIKSFRGGISDFADKGVAGSGKWLAAADIRGKEDNLSCLQALKSEGVTSEGYIFEDLILWFVAAPDNCIYGFGDQGRIYKRTSEGVWSKVYTDPYGKITGAALWWQIVEQDPVTQIATHKPHLFWATETRLNHKEIPGESDWSDVNATITAVIPSNSRDPETGDVIYDTETVTQEYPKTNLDSAPWHTMSETTGALMIANDYKIALVGYDTSYTPEILQFAPGQQATTIAERGDDMVIGTSSSLYNSDSALYSWRFEAESWIGEHKLKAKQIEAMIDTEFLLLVASGQLWFSDMYSDLPVCDFPSGGHAKPGGVSVKDNVALFAMDGCVRRSANQYIAANGIYAYGRRKNSDNPVLTLDYPILCDQMGGLLVNGETLLTSCRTVENSANVYKVMTLDHDHKQICEYESLELSFPYQGVTAQNAVARVVIATRPMPEGTKLECFYRLDVFGAWIKAHFLSEMDSQNDSETDFVSGNKAIYVIGSPADIIEVKLVLTPFENLTPEIESIHVEFSTYD